jgi:hypothetical protein
MKCKVCGHHINLGMKGTVTYDEVDFKGGREIEFKLTCIACGALHYTFINIDDMVTEFKG